MCAPHHRFGGRAGAPPASVDAVKALRSFTLSDTTPIPVSVDVLVSGVEGSIVAVPASFGPSVSSSDVSAILRQAPSSVAASSPCLPSVRRQPFAVVRCLVEFDVLMAASSCGCPVVTYMPLYPVIPLITR